MFVFVVALLFSIIDAQPTPAPSITPQCTGSFEGEPCMRGAGQVGTCQWIQACISAPCRLNCTAGTPLDNNCLTKPAYGACLAASNKLGRCETIGNGTATCQAVDDNVRKCVNLTASYPCDVKPAGSCQRQADSQWLECVANSEPISLCSGKGKNDSCTLFGGIPGQCIDGNRVCVPRIACPRDRPIQCTPASPTVMTSSGSESSTSTLSLTSTSTATSELITTLPQSTDTTSTPSPSTSVGARTEFSCAIHVIILCFMHIQTYKCN